MKKLFPDSEDKTQPHFSLKEMMAIPPYKGPKRALVELMNEVERQVHHFRKECWNITIELLADHLGIIENPWKFSLPNVKWAGPISKPSYPQFQQLKEDVQKTGLIEAYIKAAKKEPWDYLGEIFTEEELAGRHNRLGQLLTPRQIVDFMVKCVMGEKAEKKSYSYAKPDFATLVWQTAEALAFNDALPINLLAERARRHTVQNLRPLLVKYEPEPITDLDPCTGTGRFLLGATLMYPKAPLLLYGIEIDLSLYRACLVNMAMFSNHPYMIICADTLMIDGRYCGVDSKIWGLGNRWEPADISPFYFKLKPPFKFSLAALAKTMKQQQPTPIPVPVSQTSTAFSLAQFMRAKKKT
jgi:hypothetical protein